MSSIYQDRAAARTALLRWLAELIVQDYMSGVNRYGAANDSKAEVSDLNGLSDMYNTAAPGEPTSTRVAIYPKPQRRTGQRKPAG
jgi:hypothetical protein